MIRFGLLSLIVLLITSAYADLPGTQKYQVTSVFDISANVAVDNFLVGNSDVVFNPSFKSGDVYETKISDLNLTSTNTNIKLNSLMPSMGEWTTGGANSFFDVYLECALSNGNVVRNNAPIRLTCASSLGYEHLNYEYNGSPNDFVQLFDTNGNASGAIHGLDFQMLVIPEPASIFMLATGGLGLLAFRRKK
jgi:hypothetical protein